VTGLWIAWASEQLVAVASRTYCGPTDEVVHTEMPPQARDSAIPVRCVAVNVHLPRLHHDVDRIRLSVGTSEVKKVERPLVGEPGPARSR